MEEQDIFSTNYTTQGEPNKDLGVGDIFGSSPTRQFAEDLPFTSDTPRTSNVDVAKAQKYIGTDVFDDLDIEERMAKGQSWGSKFGGFVAQSLAEIGGGTLQGFGSIYEIIDNAISEANNGDADFNNLLIQLGTNIQEGAKEQFPIYREDRDKAIDLNDAGWWFENATSLASTLSLLIPSVTAVKGVGYIGKLAGIADKVGDTAKFFGKTGLTAAIMRNGENMRESLDVFNTTKKEALQELSNIDDFNSWILTPAGQEYMNEIGERDVTPENAANWIASKAGWHSYKWNSANIVFDLIQAGTLFRGAGKFTRTNVLGGKTALREAAGLETSLAKKTARMFNPLVGTFAGQFTEGIEEGINFIGGEEGKYYGKELLNTRPDNKELPERLAGYVKDPALWNSFAWGIAGGSVFQSVSNILTKDARKQQDINKLTEINNRGKLIADAAQTKQLLFTKFKNGEINEDELKDSVSDITDTLGYHLGMTAAKTGNVDILLETLDNPDFQGKIAASYSADELKNLTISQDELVNQVKEGVLKAEDNYKTFSNYLWASSASQAAKEALITTQMQTASDVLRHENAVKKLTDKYNKLVQEETETNAVSSDMNFNTALDYEGVKLASAILSKSIEQTTFPVNVGDKLKLELDSLNQEKERLKTALNTGTRPDLSTVNPELIETVAALNIRKSYKGVNERILTDLKKKNLVNEIDKEFENKKKQEEADDLQKLEQDLSIGLSSGSITEDKFKEFDTTWKDNKKAVGLINKAKKQFKEQQKAKKIEAERVTPVQVEQKVDEVEQQLEVPVQPIATEVPNSVELRKQVNQQSPALGSSLLKEVDETNTVEGLQELRDKRLNTRKLKLTEDSAYIKLIDAKIAQLNQANSVETTEQSVPEPIVEETTNEVPAQEEVNNEEIVEPTIIAQSELDIAKTNFSAAFSAFSKAINNTTSAGVPLSAEVINAGIALLKAGAELGFATVKEIARYAKKEFGGNFTPEFLKGLKGAYAFADATDSLPDGIIANDDSVKELTLDNLEETIVEEPVLVQETKQEEQIEVPATVGSANLFVAPLAFITDYKSGDKSLGYKTKPENDEEAALIFTGNIQGEVTFVIDSSNPYHKDSTDESAIEIYKDGKRTKMYLNTIPSIQKQIDVVNKIIKKFEEGKELSKTYYPELNRQIDETEWVKSYWLQELKENLDATTRIREAIFNNRDVGYIANLSINSPGSIVNTRNEDKTSNWQKVDKALGEDVEIFFTHPEIKGGSLELIGTKGNRIAQRTSASEFHAGRMYVGIKGLNGDVIPARLKVNTISSQDANKVYDLILELADLIQNKNAKLDSREINEIRDKFNSILLVNKFNDDATTYFKIHQNRIELTFGEKNENKININFRFPIKGKGWVNIKTDGKLDILARFDLGERGVKDVYLVNKTKSEGRDFEKWLKAAISKKLYNVDKKKMLADSDYRDEVIQNRLLTDVGGVYNSKGELLGRTILKQEGRIENAIFSVNGFKEVNTKEVKQEDTNLSVIEGPVPNEVQPSTDNTTTNDNWSDTLLLAVSEVGGQFETSTLEEKQANWNKMFGNNVEFDGNIAELIWAKGQWAYGVFRNAAVEISSKAPKGTEYHEAFHVVSHLYLTGKQYEKVIAEKRNSNSDLANKTDIEIEEILANEFHLYSLMRDSGKTYKGVTGTIKKFFDRIYNYIKNLLDYPIDYIFDKIYSGGFNYKPSDRLLNFVKNQKQELLSAASSDVELSFTRKDIDTFVNVLTRFAGDFYLKNQNLKKEDIIADSQNNVKTYVQGLVTNVAENRAKWGISENQAKELKRRLNYFDEFWSLTKENLDKKLSIELDYDDSMNVTEIGDDLKKDWDDTKAFSRSAKETFSSELKLLIMTTPQIEKFDGDKAVTLKNAEIGIAPALDFNKVYPYLQRAMTGALNVDEMMQRLKTLSQHDMSLLYLKQKLEANPNMKRAWFFNFNKPLVNFHNYQVTTLEDKIKVKFDISNTATSYFKISNSWAEDVKTKIDLGYYTQENKEESRSLLSQLNTAKNNLDINLITEISEKLFNLAGIKMSSDIIKKIISNELNVRYYDTLMGSFKETIEKPLINIIKTLYPDKEGIVKFENYGDLNSLALQYQYYTYEGQENSFANTEGSVMFGFNNPNFLNNFFKSIKAAINPHYNNSVEAKQELLNMLKGYASDPSMKYSNWLWDTGNGGFLKLVDGQKDVKGLTISHINYNFLRNFNLYSFDGVKNRITGDGYRYSSMSDEDWKLTELLDYLSAEQKDHSYINVPVVIQSDSGNSFAIRTNNFQYKSANDLKQGGFIFEVVKNTIRQEILRMKNASDLMFTRNLDGSLKVKEGLDVSKLQNLYHYKLDKQGNPMLLDSNGYPTGNVFKFQNMILEKDGQFKSLNDIDILFYNGVINLGSGNTLTASQNAELNSFISDFINYEINETKKNFGKFADTLNQMQNERGKELLAVYSNDFDKFIAEFAMNHYIANVEQSNFFNGVIAEYKSPTDTNKRAKEITSPIVSGDIEVLGDTYQAVILKDIKLQSNTIDSIIKGLERELKRQNKNYRGMDVEADNIKKKKPTNKLEEQILSIASGYLSINTTDAQGFVTLKRYRAILSSFGRMFQDTINLLDKVEKGEQINIDDYQRLLVPLKPFYYGRFFDEYSGRMMSRQVKLSVFPLIGNLVKGSELETLRDYAEANNVDEMYFESAIKVGATDITNIADSNGRLLPDFATKLKPQTLFNKFWGLQLDVVQHTMDAKNKLGIQMAKIIPSGLSLNEDYELDGKKVDGDIIKKEWHDVLAAHIEESALDLLKQLKAKQIDGKWVIDSNSKEIKELLLKELKRRNLAQNYSDALEYNRKGEFNLPLFYSAMANKFESLLSSLFKNNVTDLKTAGSHLVLGSTAFLTKAKQNNKKSSKLEVKNLFTVKPIQAADKKATIKASVATKYIGFADGISGSSTALYAKQIGQYANTGNYNSSDTVFVSIGGKRGDATIRKQQQDRTIREALKAIETGATLITDNKSYVEASDYNEGEKRLATNLNAKGYIYSEQTINGQVLGVWNKSADLFTESNNNTLDLGIEWTQKVIDRNDFNLKSVQYDNDKTIKAEAIMPRWTKKFFKDGQPININELPEDVRTFVMNRIPTESKHSIIVLEAVGFMPAELDALMIVPDDIVNMMGSDFDVDSGYNWHYNVETKDNKVQVINYDNSKKAKENSKQQRENRLLDITLAIMLSPYTFIEQLTPSSFDDLTTAKKELQEIRSVDESNINPNSVNGQLRFRSAVIAGRALKGLAASMNGILPVYQDIGAKFEKNEDNTNGFVVKYDKKDLNIDEVKNRYKDDILNETSDTITILHRYIANSPNNDYLNVNGVNLTGYTSQTLANVLDIVKEGITPNLNTYTFGVFQSLLSVGSNIEYASRFIDQPAINYLFKQVQAGESLLDSTTMSPITRTRNLYQTELFKTMYYMGKYENDKDAMKQFRYLTKVDKNGKVVWDTDKSLFVKEENIEGLLGYNPTQAVYFSKSELEENIKYSVTRNKKLANSSKEELQKQADYIIKQLQILDLFSIYRDNANKIGAASRVLSFDKIASSPSLNATPEFELKLAAAESLAIIDKNGNNIITGVYSENSTYPTLKAYWEFSNKLAFDLFSNLFIKYTPAFQLASSSIANRITKPDENTFKNIQDYLVSLAMTKIPFFTNLDKKTILGVDTEIKVNDEIEFEEFKNLSTANKVFILKSKNFKLLYNNPNHLLNYLEPKLSNDNIDRTGFHKIEMNKPAPSEGVDDYISDSFRDMYFGSDKFMKNLAEDLIRYAFITNGLTFGKDSFSNYIPEFILNNALNLGDELRMIHTKAQDARYLQTEFPEYADLFFKNNWYNKNIIPRVVTRFKKVDGELVIDEDETEFAGETVYKTVKNTPIWELNGDFLIVKEEQLKGEDRTIQRAEYVLLNQRKGDTIQQILMKRNFDENQGVYYYYPVNKLGNTHIKNEFTENSVLFNNNATIPESQYEFFFERSHMSSWQEASKAFYENQRNKESNNDNINCK